MSEKSPVPVRLTYDYHLEKIIWEDVPEGVRLNAAQILARMAAATPEQQRRARASLAAKTVEVEQLMDRLQT